MRVLTKLTLLLSAMLTGGALAEDPPQVYPQIDLSLFNETGETRRCVTFSDVEGFVPIDGRNLFFIENGEYLLNYTNDICGYITNPDHKIVFNMRTGKACKNTRVHIYKRTGTAPIGSCALGNFKVLTLKDGVEVQTSE